MGNYDVNRQRDPRPADAQAAIVIDNVDIDERVVYLHDRLWRRFSQRAWLETRALLRFVATELMLRDDPGIERLQTADDRVAARLAKSGRIASSPCLVADRLIRSSRLREEDRIDRGVDLALGVS